MRCIACIVEGQGDVASIPIIVRRIGEALGVYDVVVQTYRVHQAVVRLGELERVVDRAARSLPPEGRILVVLDADDDAPCELGPTLTARARAARPDVTSEVVLAKREKEARYLAAAESLRGRRGLPADLLAPDDPESVPGATEWLSGSAKRSYSPITDEPALAALFSLELARERSASFARLWRKLGDLLA